MLSARLHRVHLLLAVPAACPVTPHSHRSHRHQEDDHHVVVQHGLVGSIHGNQPSLTKRLGELQTQLGEEYILLFCQTVTGAFGSQE